MPSLSNQSVFAPFPLKVAWSGISLIHIRAMGSRDAVIGLGQRVATH